MVVSLRRHLKIPWARSRMQSAIPSSPLPRAAMGPSRGTRPLSRAVCIRDAPCGVSFGIHHPRWPGLSASLVRRPSTRWFFRFRRFYPVFTLKPPINRFYPVFTPFWEGKMCRGKKEGKNGVNSFYPGVKWGKTAHFLLVIFILKSSSPKLNRTTPNSPL